MNATSRRAGFSLVELSVVIVVIALLAGGVVAAKSLIRSAELRHIMVELELYKSTVKTFRERYKALPGDMANATQFWGMHPDCADDPSTDIYAAGVCDGDGDGRIGEQSWTSTWSIAAPNCSWNSTTAQSVMEQYQFWKHLEQAGMLTGNFLGRPSATPGVYWEVGVNLPVSNAGKNMTWIPLDANPCDTRIWGQNGQGQAMLLGAGDATFAARPTETLLPEEVWGIDTKVDDGMPGKGNVRALFSADSLWGATSNCTTATLRALGDGAQYNLRPASGVVPRCAMYFPNALN